MEPLSDISSLDQFERDYWRPRSGRTLIVGSRVYPGREDRRALFDDVVGWDLLLGEGVDQEVNLEHPVDSHAGTFAHIECISVLEHSQRPWLLAANLESLLEIGGTLHVSVPFVWRVHAYPDDFWRFTVSGVRALFQNIAWSTLIYANQTLTEKVTGMRIEGHQYFPRTLVLGFGRKENEQHN